MVTTHDGDGRAKRPIKPERAFKPGIREEELCQIINLRKNLDYSEILIKYAQKYLTLGWELVAVNAQGGMPLDLDFRRPEEEWSSRLAAMGLEGIQVNLGIRTGRPSRLLVLEVHREESRPPFHQRGEWSSACVAEVGTSREQHYYVTPRGWQPPPSYFLESFQVMVFGEEGLVLAPPSLEPRANAALRWLKPPWESPPTRPSPALCKFLRESAPSLMEGSFFSPPPVPTWGEIYPHIIPHPPLLQALLTPAASQEEYYRNLVTAARRVGLSDSHLLLGLLWHAPLGDGPRNPQRWRQFQELIREEREPPGEGESPEGFPGAKTGGSSAGYPCQPGSIQETGVKAPAGPEARGARGASPGECWDSWADPLRLGRDTLLVDRHRYEAMIYELGKLGAWQEFFKQQQRENRQLREKIEAQWQRQLEFFRHLASKNGKKGWRPW